MFSSLEVITVFCLTSTEHNTRDITESESLKGFSNSVLFMAQNWLGSLSKDNLTYNHEQVTFRS